VHISEVEATDGTMIISVPHLLKGHLEKGHYNIGLHLMAEAFKICYLRQSIEWEDDIWEKLESISSITRGRIEAYLGMPLTDPWPVAVHHQMMYSDAQIEQVVSLLPHLVSHPFSTAARR
jgi:hypothetical protein